MAHTRGLKIASNTNFLRKPRQLDLLGKDWNSPIINIHKELKKTVSKKFKEIMRRVFHQINNINKDRNYNDEPTRNSRVERNNNKNEKFTKEIQQQFFAGRKKNLQRKREFVEMIQSEQQKVERKERKMKSLRHLWGTTKNTSIGIMGVTEGEERTEKIDIWKNNG